MKSRRRTSLLRLLKRSTGTGSVVTGPRTGEVWKTLLIVVPLTLLIWVYAERAQNRDDDIKVVLDAATSDPTTTVTVADNTRTEVKISLNGSRGQIDELIKKIQIATTDGQLRVTLPSGYAAVGQRSVDLASLLNEVSTFNDSGVRVTKTDPANLKMEVDPITSREVAVVPPRDLPVTLQRYSFDPPRVTVRGPLPAVNQQFGEDSPTIVIDARGIDSVATGGERTLEVPVVPPRDARLKLNVSKVKMTFEAGSTIQTGTIRSVFIDVRRPVSEDGASRVLLKKTTVLNNVQVRGPSNLVNRLVGDRPETSVKAVLKVSQDDVGTGEQTRTLEFPDLDPAVKLVSGPYDVTFEVRPLTGEGGR